MDKTLTWRRRAGLVSLAAAPVLLLAATAADPALGDGAWEVGVAADPEGALLHTVLLHWAWVLFVPGLLTLLSPVGRRGRVLATISWVAIVFGLVTFAGLVLTDVTAIAVADTVDRATMAVFDARVSSYTWMTLGWQLPGLIGWAVALVLTPVAAARAGVVGWWYAATAGVGAALYFVFAISPVPVSLAGPAVLVVANAVVAARLWRATAVVADEGFARFRRSAGAVCLVAAPVSLVIGMATVPGDAFSAGAFADHPTAAQASAFFLHLAWLLFIPGILALLPGSARRSASSPAASRSSVCCTSAG